MKLKLDLTNCYGISKLQKELDFTKSDTSYRYGVYSLYAPNGTLKTSLAKTFKDIEADTDTKDLIFSDRTTTRTIKINDQLITKDQVMVIDSYNESYSSKQLSTLLVNESLKREYDEALNEIDGKKSSLIRELAKSFAKQARSVPELVCSAFNRADKELFELLLELHDNENPDFCEFSKYKYEDLFNQKVLDLVSQNSFIQELTDYINTYEKLISESAVLSRDFNHYRAGVISKSLAETQFFKASHSINLSVNGKKEEVKSKERLDEIFQKEQDRILQTPELTEKFSKVDSKLTTKDTQGFRDFIAQHQTLLPEYKDIQFFKKKFVIGHLQSHQLFWDELVTTYKSNQDKVKDIIERAKQEETTWKLVVDTFNKRFSVPFTLQVGNQDEVILNNAAPMTQFNFDDGRGAVQPVNHDTLIRSLSQGEKRALYILNILFEVEVRKARRLPVLIVIDDIADSFDYKNKYAIVEYLREIAKISHFYLLLLTHNFDFHRIIGNRIIGGIRSRRLFVSKTVESIELHEEKYQNDVFNAWKKGMHQNEYYMLASIPFARNLAEYCGYQDHYETLTSLIHVKQNSPNITISDLQRIYRIIFTDKSNLTLPNQSLNVIEQIFAVSDRLSSDANDSPDLECKVIVAMAIRLKAEKFMISQIADQSFLNGIKSNQTRVLFDKYVEKYPDESASISLLDQVNLMTPENIHLNSFMYEPILDMSPHRLYGLYNGIKQLNEETA